VTQKARLVLMAPASEGPGEIAARIGAALEGGPVAAVILPLPALDDRSLVKFVKPIAPVVQQGDSALLLDGHPEIVARAGADGVHISDPRDLAAAIAMLRPQERIIGAGGLRARHDAMEAAEAGADYVMFGEPRPDGTSPPFPAVLERAGWWAELFETPCVAWCTDLGDVGRLAGTGCEFIALSGAVFDHPEGPAEAVRRALDAIASAEVPVR
jgi:thiamine-phosphate pyrophosphorylase